MNFASTAYLFFGRTNRPKLQIKSTQAMSCLTSKHLNLSTHQKNKTPPSPVVDLGGFALLKRIADNLILIPKVSYLQAPGGKRADYGYREGHPEDAGSEIKVEPADRPQEQGQ